MTLAICVIAKNEAKTIAPLAAQLAAQTLLVNACDTQIIVVANGCSDDTAAVAREAFNRAFGRCEADILIHETPVGGKARSWNIAIHDLIDASVGTAIFLDADIELADVDVLQELADILALDSRLAAVSGHPVKDIARKHPKSLIDRFSLAVSRQSLPEHSINGSLYAARMGILRDIWLPVPTPGEDGLLSAMIHTNGFSRTAQPDIIARVGRPTHYFAAHSIRGFFRHEQRMTVGTVINGWICEFLWAGRYDRNVGPLIGEWNETDPKWVSRLVESRVDRRWWVLPSRMMTWRLHNLRGGGFARAFRRVPFSLVATLLNIWPAVQANRTLKRANSADFW